jgi:hypothetical protein
MIDDVSYIESYIKQRLPTITVFQNQTGDSDIEIDVQNVPGRPLNLVRLLLSRENAAAIRRNEDLAGRLIATLEQALTGPSDEDEALLDLRGQL